MHTDRRLFRTFLLRAALVIATGCGTSAATPDAGRETPDGAVGTGLRDATTEPAGESGTPSSGAEAGGSEDSGSEDSGAPAPGEDAGTGTSSKDAGLPPVTTAPAIGNRQDIDFNLDWKFNSGDVTGADATAFADSTWSYVDLPHTTKFVTADDPLALLGISWYRKHFTMAASQKGMKVFLEFGAAMQLADVWVNGTHMLQHQGGYTPFTIDITGAVTYDGTDNVVAVKLDNDANAAFPPGKAAVDFEYYGGLYRKVTLHVTDLLHVTDAVFAGKAAGGGVFVTYPAVSATAATVNVQTDVINESTAAKTAGVQSQILDVNGNVVGSATSSVMIAAGADSAVSQVISLTNPNLWHPNTPYLYTLRTTVLDGTTAVDGVTTRIGIRRIGWSHGGLTINGAPYKALGANLHENIYGLGNAIPDLAWYYDVKRLREGGVTFARAPHYPHSPAFYDACDALGVLVLNPQSGWQNYESTTAFANASYQELRDLIRRDRNHPSIVAWEDSLNETSFPETWAQETNTIVHQEYPGNQAFTAQWKFTDSDILIDATQHNIRESTDTRPIVIDEYGDWDYGGNTSTSRQAREAGEAAMLTQARNVEDGTALNYALSWYSAGCYWDYEDWGGTFSPAGLRTSGLVDMSRLPKFAYYFMQSQRDPAVVLPGVDSGPVAYIASLWQSNSASSVEIYSNCDEVSLYKNGTLVATRSPDTGTTETGGKVAALPHPPFTFPAVAFTAGSTLRADCVIGSAVKASFSRQSPGAASAVRLRPEATTLVADASDARLVFIDVVDANGTVVPTSSAPVSLQVTGAGVLLGPATVTMKGGQLAAWVRSTRTAGTVTLSASGTGLTPATVSLTTTAVAGLPPLPAGR